MTNIDTKTLPGNAEINDAPDAALQRRADFAAAAARTGFGNAYARPEAAGFVDRSPGELRIIHALRCQGAGE